MTAFEEEINNFSEPDCEDCLEEVQYLPYCFNAATESCPLYSKICRITEIRKLFTKKESIKEGIE